MKKLRFLLGMFVCSGLCFAFALGGCGDDDDEDQMGTTCRSAVDTLTSEPCPQAAIAIVDPWIQGCVVDLCQGDPACIEENCALAFLTSMPPACQEAVAYFQHDAEPACRECFGACTADFFPCVLTPGNLPEDCVNAASGCLEELCP